MNKEEYVLGIDVGTSSVKVSFCNSRKQIVVQASAPTNLISIQPGYSEENPEEWWESILAAVHECKEKCPAAASNVKAIGVTGMLPALVLLDDNFSVLRFSIQQNDLRAKEEISFCKNSPLFSDVYDITGSVINQQSIGPKLMWLKKNEPHIYKKISYIMGSYDYINFRLTGNIAVEANWALESGLYDFSKNIWSDKLIKAYDISKSILPPVKFSYEIIGRLTHSSAKFLGINADVPVISGSADHIAAALASGIKKDGDLLIKFGSAGDILYYSQKAINEPRLYIDFHDIPNSYLINGCMATSGSLLKWFVTQFCYKDYLEVSQNLSKLYKLLDTYAENIAPGSNGLVVLPYFLGEKTPIFDANAKGVFWGLSLSHTRYHIYRAIMEAICYGFKHHIDVLRENGLHIKRVVMSEGGAASPLWRQIAADILNLPIIYMKNNPGASVGVAFVAGMAINMWDNWDEIESFSELGETTYPNSKNAKVYQLYYKTYRQLYTNLKYLPDPYKEANI